jgi:predicted O-methyltransferase YrrM
MTHQDKTGLVPGPYDSWKHPGDPGEIDARGKRTRVPRLSVTREELGVLSALCSGLHVLEIGTGTGSSTSAIAETAASVVTIDADEWVRDNIAPSLPAGVRFVFRGDPIEFSPECAFIDGNHEESSVLQDIEFCASLLTPGSLIIMHDTHVAGVARAIQKSGFLSVVHIYDTACKIGACVLRRP